MGIVSSALSILPSATRALPRWLRQSIDLATRKPTGSAAPCSPPATLNGRAGVHGVGNSAATANPTPAVPTGHPRLRAQWPFNVRSPVAIPVAPVGQPATSVPTAIPTPSTTDERACPASIASGGCTGRSSRVLRRISHSESGSLVIAGRMAEVCAELDRMAALEGLQAR
jgi:hypothetical protein